MNYAGTDWSGQITLNSGKCGIWLLHAGHIRADPLLEQRSLQALRHCWANWGSGHYGKNQNRCKSENGKYKSQAGVMHSSLLE